MTNVSVSREGAGNGEADRLWREEWVFWYDDRTHVLRVSNYTKYVRPTTRHKFRPVVVWTQHRHRDNDGMNPPLPSDVTYEAVEKFRAGLVVEPW